MTGEPLVPVTLEPSALTKFDRTALLKEIVATAPPGPLFYAAIVELLAAAGEAKGSATEVKGLGRPRGQGGGGQRRPLAGYVLVRMARALADQPARANIALDLIRRAERLLDPGDEPSVQLAVLDLLKRLLIQTNNSAEADAIQARIDSLEARDFRDYVAASPIRPDPFPGRKAGSNRAVLLELFTGADDPPSVAAVLAFDALGRVFKTTEVVRLAISLEPAVCGPTGESGGRGPLGLLPGPARQCGHAAVGRHQRQTGRRRRRRPGSRRHQAEAISRRLIEPLLDTAAAAALQLAANRDGDKVTVDGQGERPAKTERQSATPNCQSPNR